MAVVPDNFSGDINAFPIVDGKTKVTSLKSPTEGLAPEGGSLSPETPVIAIVDGIDTPPFTWNYVRRGTNLDKSFPAATFELGSGLFLSYDFSTNLVVVKKNSQPAWIVTRDSGGSEQFKISPFTNPTKFLTYTGQGARVTVADAASDVSTQIWIIHNL